MQIRCPHCFESTDVASDARLTRIRCSSCGSEFGLIDDETVTSENDGKTLGHFELLERLGMGAFGAVWLARDSSLDRHVAIKIPRKERLNAAEAEQFVREARAAAQLRHPNIVAIHEVGKQDGQVYIVSDYIDGMTLADWLFGRELSARGAATICVKLCGALQHAHEQRGVNSLGHRFMRRFAGVDCSLGRKFVSRSA